MKTPQLKDLEVLIGDWDWTMSNAWFLDSLETTVVGTASFEWIEHAFVLWRFKLGASDVPESVSVIGYSSATERFEAFYYDNRGVSRIFDMRFDGKHWSMLRQDPDFYQRFTAQVNGDTIAAAWEASEDQGKTWRKDFDLLFTKVK
ncbi:MAG TPA: hypothetical protein VKT82_07170 [Ktedonobacterales bacterium]|nr:hypothetical protein [Ktedonobacterales bacterium]